MFVLANMWFQTLMRTFFFNIDKIVFNFISTIYDFLITIARTSVLSQADIINMADRIYRLLAVFMVFKVTFSLIMYVVNPDDFSDKTKGVGKLTTNIIISLSLLILTPYIFSYAYQLQTIILEDNSLSALIFGNDNDNANQSSFNTAGDKMAYITMAPFFTPNLGIDELYACAQLTTRKNDSIDNSIVMNEECDAALITLSNSSDGRFDEQTYRNYKAGVESGNLGILFRQDAAIATNKDNTEYIIEYKYLFSTILGIVVILLLITFCMDVALRSIKLAFLQLIAPIPIISYVDPKSGKDGMFKKWYQMCFKTYISLFIRLLALYFAAYIIGRIDRMVDIVDGSYVTNSLVKIAIIIGALMFAKQLPKILEGLGIKLDGDGKFFLNPLKKFEEQAAGGKQILGLGAAGAAAGLAGATNFASRVAHPNSWRGKDGKFSLGTGLKNMAKAPVSAVGGAAGAAFRGTKKAIKGEKPGKIFSSSYGEAMFAKLQREDLSRKGSTLLGRRAADLSRITGNYNAGQRQILEMGEQDNAVAAREYTISSNKAKLARMKEDRFKPLENLQSVSKNVDDLLEADGKVKAAKTAWENASKRGMSDVEVERMRQEYKKVKAERLEQIYNDNTGKEHAHAALKQVVDLHNNIQARLEQDSVYKGKTKAISTTTDFKYKEQSGGNYDYDSEGNIVRVKDGTGTLVIDNDRSVSGVNDMGFNDDSIRDEKTIFESSDEYREISDAIESDQQWIENFKASEEYVRAHDKNSAALADNAAVGTDAPQKEGWTPNPEHVDAVTYAQGSYGGNTTSFVSTGNISSGHRGGNSGGHHGHRGR